MTHIFLMEMDALNKIILQRITLFLFLFAGFTAFSQENKVPALERQLTIRIESKPSQFILDQIATQTGVVFSYKSEILNSYSSVSVDETNKSVRYILYKMFGNSFTFKEKGKFIILKKNKESLKQADSKKQKVIIEGYVNAAETGEKINQVSVYNKDVLVSTTTDKYGYFKIELPPLTPKTELRISKSGYSDTILMPVESKSQFVDVTLTTKKEKWKDIIDPTLNQLSSIKLPDWLLSKDILVNTQNLSDTIFKKTQVSFVPYLGTNNLLTGNTANNLSFNIIAGYVQEVRVAEFGGILNIVRDSVKSVQFSGVGNIVGKSARGFQGAGTFNLVNRFQGFQWAGILNITRECQGSVQLAGIINFNKNNFKGVQVAGISNFTGDLKGLQVAGITNVALGTSGNTQVSGIMNLAKDADIQVSSIFNLSKSTKLQVTAIANVSKDSSGIQVSGIMNYGSYVSTTQVGSIFNIAKDEVKSQVGAIFNYAQNIKSVQVALINIADTCEGIPVGLVSIVRKGYHKLEVSADELKMVNVSFRTGVRKFHSIISAGIGPKASGDHIWSIGIGLGTSFKKSDKTNFDLDYTLQYLSTKDNFAAYGNLNRIYIGVEQKLTKVLSFSYGITCNALVGETDNLNAASLEPYSFANTKLDNTYSLKSWIGAKVGVRFF